jgi:hypothetical protein
MHKKNLPITMKELLCLSIRYKGWLEQGYDKFATRLTISGENFVKFDLPQQKASRLVEQPHPAQLSLNR